MLGLTFRTLHGIWKMGISGKYNKSKCKLFQIGHSPPPPPPKNVSFLKSIFDFLLIRQKIDLIKCKLWVLPPPPFLEKVYILIFLDPSLMETISGKYLLLCWKREGGRVFIGQKNGISPFFDASGKINIGATIRIGWEIRCFPYAGFLKAYNDHVNTVLSQILNCNN